jgi:acyl carrier protein
MNAFQEIAPETDAHLREILRHCPPCAYYAAYQFRATGDIGRLPTLFMGVIGRYVPADLQAKLKDPDDALRLQEDLAIDSLTLMEIGLIAEDVLQIDIADDEIKRLRTLGDVMRLMEGKARRLSSAA